MADEETEIVRGNEATSLLSNRLLKEALDHIESHFNGKILNSELSQAGLREEAFRMLCACREFKKHLTHVLQTGKMATVTRDTRVDAQEREREHSEWDGSADGQPRVGHTQSP